MDYSFQQSKRRIKIDYNNSVLKFQLLIFTSKEPFLIMKYYIPFLCLFLLTACDNEKKHFNDAGQIQALYKGKKLVEEYTYQKDNPGILAKSVIYNDDNSFITNHYNKQGVKFRVDSTSASGGIEKLYYTGPNPNKISKREFYGTDSLYMANFDTLGAEMAVVIQSKKITKRSYRGNLISLHEKTYVNGAKSEWDYHPNGLLNKFKLHIEDEKVDFFEFHNIQGELENKRISVNGYHSLYNNALHEISKDSLLHFFAIKRKLDAKTIELKKAAIAKAIDKEAKYPGGKKALKNHLEKHIVYGAKTGVPQPCKSIDINLFIDKNGKAYLSENPSCLHFDILSSAYKAIENMPLWKAAMDEGKPCGSFQKVSIKL